MRIVAYGLVRVSAVMVPLLEGVNVYHTLLDWPLLAAPVAHPPGSAGSACAFVFGVARTEFTVSLYGNCAGVMVIGVALSSFGGATSPASILNVNVPPGAVAGGVAGVASDAIR